MAKITDTTQKSLRKDRVFTLPEFFYPALPEKRGAIRSEKLFVREDDATVTNGSGLVLGQLAPVSSCGFQSPRPPAPFLAPSASQRL